MKPLNIYVCLITGENENDIWYQHIARTLCRMGHNVLIPRQAGLLEAWYRGVSGAGCSKSQKAVTVNILDDVRKKHTQHGVDLLFCNMFPFQFSPALFTELEGMSIPSVYFFCDNFAYKEVAEKYGPHATLNWVPEKGALPQFASSGSRFIYLPMAANPDIFYPIDTDETVDISFLGSKTSYRRNLLGQVLNAGLKLKIYGTSWLRNNDIRDTTVYFKPNLMDKITAYARFKKNALVRFLCKGMEPALYSRFYAKLGEEYDIMLQDTADEGPPSLDSVNKVYAISSVSIGIGDQFNPSLEEKIVFYAKLRDFEATMAGACYLTQRVPGCEELFTDEKEAMFYSSVEELIDKARFLLKDKAFRKKMRHAARARALSEHTWAHRFGKVFSELGL
jgi:glycosyltransferase involved in cell wall biosynthesis